MKKHRGKVNSPCANAFAQQKHFTAQTRRGDGVGRSACTGWEVRGAVALTGKARWERLR